MEYKQLEQSHVEKLQQAEALIKEVLAGEQKEVETPSAAPSLRDKIAAKFGSQE